MSYKTRLFVILFLAGLPGVVSILLIDIEALAAALPFRDDSDVPPITPLIKILSLIQPTVLLALAVFTGVALAFKVGLSAPVAEAAADRLHIGSALKSQILPGVVGGVLGGTAIVLASLLWAPLLPPEAVTRISTFQGFVPLPTRLLYGGITEEILLRWGFMTLVVWVTWRFFRKSAPGPDSGVYIAAIVISALLFGILHLPIAYVVFPAFSASLTLFVIVANSLFGVIAGYLFWKKGLESAMIAHTLAHVVMFVANYIGAYF
ncbi:MAG TPA: CPBP family intramembrane glutamic endopeptidase [Pyrinomonadaceae bacterium]|nr:CPBP family intramembrane glutamic endopeptidase [Pyrinomonadaceae bacterium]